MDKLKEEVEKHRFVDYHTSVFKMLDKLGFEKKLADINKVILKPNLLENSPPPCTTDVRCVEEIVKYILEVKGTTEVVIIEGSGGCDTFESYNQLGYKEMAERYKIKLLDVDQCDYVKLIRKDTLVYKEIYLPKVVVDNGFIISIPSLKDHTITTVTLSFKNMIGLLPKKYYGGYWSYNRSDVHRVGVNKAIVDLSRYINIDMAIVDGRLGQEGNHLPGGREFKPNKNIIIGGYDPLEVDKAGAEILEHNWREIKHLKMISEIIKSS